jgi:hypothetical protein
LRCLAAISCRKDHVESSIGDYINALDEDGHPIKREGFMVNCKTDLDCMSRCGGAHYSFNPIYSYLELAP